VFDTPPDTPTDTTTDFEFLEDLHAEVAIIWASGHFVTRRVIACCHHHDLHLHEVDHGGGSHHEVDHGGRVSSCLPSAPASSAPPRPCYPPYPRRLPSLGLMMIVGLRVGLRVVVDHLVVLLHLPQLSSLIVFIFI
jgi:hypothetical protein